jgi:hypothetical protein
LTSEQLFFGGHFISNIIHTAFLAMFRLVIESFGDPPIGGGLLEASPPEGGMGVPIVVIPGMESLEEGVDMVAALGVVPSAGMVASSSSHVQGAEVLRGGVTFIAAFRGQSTLACDTQSYRVLWPMQVLSDPLPKIKSMDSMAHLAKLDTSQGGLGGGSLGFMQLFLMCMIMGVTKSKSSLVVSEHGMNWADSVCTVT